MNHRIVRVVAAYFYCVAGCSGVSGATSDLLYKPYSIRLDSAANMYVADEFNNRIQTFIVIGNSCGKSNRVSNTDFLLYFQRCPQLNLQQRLQL